MNYTSIEQSKKLLEFGLNPDSSDMCWINGASAIGIDVPFVKSKEGEGDIPCWSVSALLDMMPASIGVMNNLTITKDCANGIYNVSYEPIADCPIILFVGQSLIDAVVDMIKWLINNNYWK